MAGTADSLRRKRGRGPKLVDVRSAGLSNSASAGQRLRKKRQALVHPVIDAGMVAGQLLVAMPDHKLIQPSYETAGAVEQVELVLFAAIDVEGFQPCRAYLTG